MYERYPVPLGVLILGLFVCTWAQEESSTMNTGSVMPNNSTEPVPHFLKHGESYAGQTADTILSRTIKTVALALTIDNWSKWALIDPFFDIQCGELVSSLSKQNQRDPVQLIKPGYSEMMLFEKKSGISGVCGVVTIGLEVPPKEDPEYIQIMFSVPFSLSVRGSYLAVGISPILINATGLFNSFYYYDELTFERQESGNLVEFASDRVKIRGTMTPDTYKPVLSVVVLPVNSNDTFQPGEYFSPRLQNDGCRPLPSILVHSYFSMLVCVLARASDVTAIKHR